MRPTLSRAAVLGLIPSGLLPLFQQPASMPPGRCSGSGLSSPSKTDPAGSRSSKRVLDLTAAIPETAVRHAPPPGYIGTTSTGGTDDHYAANPTVFGRILAGQLPCRVLRETPDCLAFVDRTPRAPLHALVIPKRYVPSLFDVTVDDRGLLEELRAIGRDLAQTYAPEAFAAGDYRLCFHVPPFNSVDHLHLHVLAPVSDMAPYYRFVKYQDNARWSLGVDRTLRRLRHGLPAVPYRAPSGTGGSWWR